MNTILRSTAFSILSAAALIALGGCGQAEKPEAKAPLDRSVRPAAGPAPEASFPAFETRSTENGLKVFVVESQREPTVTFRLMFRSGSLFDGAKPGLAEFVAGLIDSGVEGKNAYELADSIDFIGGELGAEASSDFIAVTVSGLSKYKEQLADLLADVVLRPVFPEQELDKLKQRTLSNLAQERQDPGAMADKLRRKLVYGAGAYGAYQTEESVASIERADLAAFHEAHFIPNNASLAVVGDITSAEALALVKERFAGWERRELEPVPDYAYPVIKGVTVHIVDRPESVQSAIRVAQTSGRRSDPSAVELQVTMSVLGGSNGRMYQNLREDKGYTYGAFSYAANAKLWGAIITSADVRNEVTEDSVRQILHELSNIRENGVEAEELTLHQNYLAGNYLLSLESAKTTAQRIQEIDIYGLAPDYYQSYVSRVVSLTPDQASAIARQKIESENVAIAIVGDAAAIKDALSTFGKVTVYDEMLEVKPAE